MTFLARLSSLGCLLIFGCSSECVLDDDIRLFAGDGATDCGTADASHDRAEVDQCATDAFGAGTPFIARYAAMGFDSKLITAVAGNTAGKVKVFRWDSAPCGSSSCSAGSAESPSSAATCVKPPSFVPGSPVA